MAEIEDRLARRKIMGKFYEGYRQQGLHVILTAGAIAADIELEPPQARRCFDYLSAKGWIRPVTISGGYSPTIELVDEMEAEGAAS